MAAGLGLLASYDVGSPPEAIESPVLASNHGEGPCGAQPCPPPDTDPPGEGPCGAHPCPPPSGGTADAANDPNDPNDGASADAEARDEGGEGPASPAEDTTPGAGQHAARNIDSGERVGSTASAAVPHDPVSATTTFLLAKQALLGPSLLALALLLVLYRRRTGKQSP